MAAASCRPIPAGWITRIARAATSAARSGSHGRSQAHARREGEDPRRECDAAVGDQARKGERTKAMTGSRQRVSTTVSYLLYGGRMPRVVILQIRTFARPTTGRLLSRDGT